MLTPEELERYARHIVLREVGGPGQAALGRARVLVIGAGGLGAPVLLYLAAAGVGTLGVIDDDTVALSNLQRQVIHGTPDVGTPKVESAAAAIARLNPHVKVATPRRAADRGERARADLAIRHRRRRLGQFRHALSRLRRLLFREEAAGDRRRSAPSTARSPPSARMSAARTASPTRPIAACFPEPPPPGTVPACAEAGILGALAGVLGSMMALEVIREIVGFGEGLVGRLLMVDARAMRFETLNYAWDEDNPLSGEKPTIKDLSVHAS